jgi:thioredoxin reductase (NADPH)
VLIGAEPHTAWLEGVLEREDEGFTLTGRDLRADGSRPARERPTLPYETSMPGVFAVGDVRAGSLKRAASAVGEGAGVVSSVHEFLAASTVTA